MIMMNLYQQIGGQFTVMYYGRNGTVGVQIFHRDSLILPVGAYMRLMILAVWKNLRSS